MFRKISIVRAAPPAPYPGLSVAAAASAAAAAAADGGVKDGKKNRIDTSYSLSSLVRGKTDIVPKKNLSRLEIENHNLCHRTLSRFL